MPKRGDFSQRVQLACEQCGRAFSVPKHRFGKARFCRRECRTEWDKTRPNPQIGRPRPTACWNKGKVGIYSAATLRRMRDAAKNRPPEEHANWRGGKRIVRGYVHIFCPTHPHRTANNTVPEHRLMMEGSLGRYLQPGEVVHHKNGKKDDNRIQNLELYSSNAEHCKLHGRNDKIENTPHHRQCSVCREIKPLNTTHFGTSRSYKYGFTYVCKPCKKIQWALRQKAKAS